MNAMLYSRISPFIQLSQDIKKPMVDAIHHIENKLPHAIDPNTADYAELIQAGFPGKIANTLIHYRSTGKVFKSLNDLSKIYGINDSLIQSLKNYLLFQVKPVDPISQSPENEIRIVETQKDIIKSSIEINKADTATLKRLPGIGNVLALRIIAYREKLGGYYSTDQLKEVYGLKDTAMIKFQSQLTVSLPYRKIKINLDSLPSIYHPYLTKKDAMLIQGYRDQHGPYKNKADLYQIKAFDQKYWERLIPYIDFDITRNK